MRIPPLWEVALVGAMLLAAHQGPSAVASADMSSDEKIADLLGLGTRYNRIVRPPADYNTTNIVYVNLIVSKLLNIDEVKQHMSLEGSTEMEWIDRRLAWLGKFNSTFDHVPIIYLPQSAVWMPDVMIINTGEDKDSKQSSTLSTVVQSDGRVFTSAPYGSKTLCDIDMLYFPYDSQTCRVIFGSWLMLKEDLELRRFDRNASSMAADTDRVISVDSDEYCITRSDFSVTGLTDHDTCHEAVFSITIQRKPLFYVMNLILPSLLILLICVLSFFLPPESGERLSLNVTLMLALTVFMQIVAGYTPAQSDSVPMLTRFFAAVVVMSAVSTFSSMFQLCCHFKGKESPTVDNWAARLVLRSQLPRRQRTSIPVRDSRSNDGGDNLQAANPESTEAGSRSCSANPAAESEWCTIGQRLDCAVFFAMVIAAVVLLLSVFFVRNPDYVAC